MIKPLNEEEIRFEVENEIKKLCEAAKIAYDPGCFMCMCLNYSEFIVSIAKLVLVKEGKKKDEVSSVFPIDEEWLEALETDKKK